MVSRKMPAIPEFAANILDLEVIVPNVELRPRVAGL
jgi:hypothetical protein